MAAVVIATRNRGKLREFARLLEGVGATIRPVNDFPDVPDVVETGKTFRDNAVKKAVEVAKATGLIAIADDSGLVVDVLNGRPGVMSARFAGEGADDRANNEKLLKELQGVPLEKRTASFICVVAAADPSGRFITVTGRCEGLISLSPKGEGGFGYDPLFYLPDRGCTMAELPPDVKDSISHRGKAVRKLAGLLPSFLASARDTAPNKY